LRLAYLGITNTFALLRLLPRSDQDKDSEILALRHQLTVLQRHLDGVPRCGIGGPEAADLVDGDRDHAAGTVQGGRCYRIGWCGRGTVRGRFPTVGQSA